MNQELEKKNVPSLPSPASTLVVIAGGWIIGTQVCSMFARGSIAPELILNVIAAVSLIVAGLAVRRSKTISRASFAVAAALFIASCLVYSRGDWTRTYTSDAMLRHYGMDVFNLKHHQEFQDKLRTGEINWVESQSVLASVKPTSFDMLQFKSKRYLRQMFWPPLRYQAWQREATSQRR